MLEKCALGSSSEREHGTISLPSHLSDWCRRSSSDRWQGGRFNIGPLQNGSERKTCRMRSLHACYKTHRSLRTCSLPFIYCSSLLSCIYVRWMSACQCGTGLRLCSLKNRSWHHQGVWVLLPSKCYMHDINVDDFCRHIQLHLECDEVGWPWPRLCLRKGW